MLSDTSSASLVFPDPPDGFRWQALTPGGAAPGDREESLEALVSVSFPARHGFTCRIRNRQRDGSFLGIREEAEADLDVLARAAGANALHSMRQVHGDHVRIAPDSRQRDPNPPPGDALIARGAGSGVAVKAADCVPVLLVDSVSGAVAGVHAGWRGTRARIVGKAARALALEVGAPTSRLAAIIGPSIRVCCFEVGPEVVSAFTQDGHDVNPIARKSRAGRARPHLDLPLANRLQLLAAGLREEAIQDAALCTRCHPAFHSYRREGPGVGRNWSVVVAGGLRAP